MENDVDCTGDGSEAGSFRETREEGVLCELKQLRERRDELNYQLQKIEFEEKQQKEKKRKRRRR